MVRIKERYLLVDIVYPGAAQDLFQADLPDILVYHQPTTDAFTTHSLVRALKDGIMHLFGDYGAGTVQRSLRGS